MTAVCITCHATCKKGVTIQPSKGSTLHAGTNLAGTSANIGLFAHKKRQSITSKKWEGGGLAPYFLDFIKSAALRSAKYLVTL